MNVKRLTEKPPALAYPGDPPAYEPAVLGESQVMQEIIDVTSNIGPIAQRLATAGVKTVIRYYNHRNVSLPTKCLTLTEIQALREAGLAVAVVFEQRAGAADHPGDNGHIEDFGGENAADDAERALELAGQLGQPKHSAIYFAVDWDFAAAAELNQIAEYFQTVKDALAGQYLVGIYGSGTVGQHLQNRQLVDHMWLAGSTGWSGFESALRAGNWSLFQRDLNQRSGIGGFDYDGDIFNPSFDNFGQFGVDGVIGGSAMPSAASALYKVKARSGLNLRSGPGETYRVIETVPQGTIVTGKGLEGPWMQVDLQGDGPVDGYMFASFLDAVSGGLPLAVAASDGAPHVAPIDVARAEMKIGVSEIPGPENNPRIVMYHSTTRGGAASDETPWCSSFVNYCVEQAGFRGTDSKAALSWEDWHQDASASPSEGNIVVFRRRAGSASGAVVGGHVGFFISQDEHTNTIQVLGGNEGNRVRIAPFPKNGVSGSFHYELLSVRRA